MSVGFLWLDPETAAHLEMAIKIQRRLLRKQKAASCGSRTFRVHPA